MISANWIVAALGLLHFCAATPDVCIDGDCKIKSATANAMLQLQSSKNKQSVDIEQHHELVAAKRMLMHAKNQTKFAIARASNREARKSMAATRARALKKSMAEKNRMHRLSIEKRKHAVRRASDKKWHNCESCLNGCIVEGVCYEQAQNYTDSNENECKANGGEWCGGSGGLDDDTFPPVHSVCGTENEYMPGNSLHGWCDMSEGNGSWEQKLVPKDDCWNNGCSPYDVGEGKFICWCEFQDGCEVLGGRWEGLTCEEEAGYWEVEALSAVHESGTCDNITTFGGEEMSSAVHWLAAQCCSNYPATVCAPDAVFVSPCKDDGDFTPDHIEYGWCEYHTHPQPELCIEAGCFYYEHKGPGFCDCFTQSQCDATNGRYRGYACADEIPYYENSVGNSLREAREQGSCDGLETTWGELLEEWVVSPVDSCCASNPKSICQPNAQLMTPCRDDADFDGEAVLHGECVFLSQPGQELCQGSQCSHWADESSTGCHCEQEASCVAAGGIFQPRTCQAEIGDWSGNIHRVLQESQDAGTCEGMTTGWGESISSFVHETAKACCRSFPVTVCEPNATVTHPCANDADFMPQNRVNEWCDYGVIVEPSHETCEDAGFCNCHKADACAHFGGEVRGETCEEQAHNWDEFRNIIKLVRESASCDNLSMPWNESFKDAARHSVKNCCATYPDSICGIYEQDP